LAYFVLLPLLWCFLHEKDWWFYTRTVNFSKKPELSKDIVLIDIAYPDKINFRKRTGQFLQQLAQSSEMPSAVGLDIKEEEKAVEESAEDIWDEIEGLIG